MSLIFGLSAFFLLVMFTAIGISAGFFVWLRLALAKLRLLPKVNVSELQKDYPEFYKDLKKSKAKNYFVDFGLLKFGLHCFYEMPGRFSYYPMQNHFWDWRTAENVKLSKSLRKQIFATALGLDKL